MTTDQKKEAEVTASLQSDFLCSYPEKPSAQSTIYQQNHEGEKGHYLAVGVHLAIHPGRDEFLGRLHVDPKEQMISLDENMATQSLTICCDILEIHGVYWLPEADVTIYARKLMWKSADALINTTPKPWSKGIEQAIGAVYEPKTEGENGISGRHAGSLNIYLGIIEGDAVTSKGCPRFIANGGNGQHGGVGIKGNDGISRLFDWNHHKRFEHSGDKSWYNAHFNPPTFYYQCNWIDWALMIDTECGGSYNEIPTSGEDAIAGGMPGEPGNAGGIATNQLGSDIRFQNTGGLAGNGKAYEGGKAGEPTLSSRYILNLKRRAGEEACQSYNVFHGYIKRCQTMGEIVETKPGISVPEKKATHAVGKSPDIKHLPHKNAWLHPLSLEKTLEFIRDLFMANARSQASELLKKYKQALGEPMPPTQPWEEDGATHWQSASNEVSAMQTKLRANLDYFGNTGGFTPVFSLPATTVLYANETEYAVRTLLLCGWIMAQDREIKDNNDAFKEAVERLKQENKKNVGKIIAAKQTIKQVNEHIKTINPALKVLKQDLKALREQLQAQAQGEAQAMALIDTAVGLATTLCMVIPVGQPVLGAIGSVAGVMRDVVAGQSDPLDALPQVGTIFTETGYKLSEQAAAAKDLAEKSQASEEGEGKDPDPVDAESLAKARAQKWASIGEGVNQGLTGFSESFSRLQVPKNEVDARLQQLQNESPEWQKISQKIQRLNEKKAVIFRALAQASQALGQGYCANTYHAAAILGLRREMIRSIGKTSPESISFIRGLAQRSRYTLHYYLYLMVKAYEAAIQKPIEVNWHLDAVMKKITDILQTQWQGKPFSLQDLDAYTKLTSPIFQDNLKQVRQQLIKDYNPRESSLPVPVGLTLEKTPDVLDQLNHAGHVHLDPIRRSWIQPNIQMARLSGIEVEKIEFDPTGPKLPESHYLELFFKPDVNGIIRRGTGLYRFVADKPPSWKAIHSRGETDISQPSTASEDMLTLILGTGSETIKQTLSGIPLWSTMTIERNYVPPLPKAEQPRIAKLFFNLSIEYTDASALHSVLTVLSQGYPSGAMIQCSPDSKNRGNGMHRMVRIFAKGDSIKLEVGAQSGQARFDHWQLLGDHIQTEIQKKPAIQVSMEDHVTAHCCWRSIEEI